MTVDDRIQAQLAELRRQREALRDEAEHLRGPGGGGTSGGGMEVRIARLESDMDHVKRSTASLDTRAAGLQKDVSDIRVELARLDERVKHLPGKGFVVTATTTTIGLLTGLVLFADKLKAALGL